MRPAAPPLRDLTPDELDVLQLAHNFSQIRHRARQEPATDVDTARIVLKLIDKAYLRVAD